MSFPWNYPTTQNISVIYKRMQYSTLCLYITPIYVHEFCKQNILHKNVIIKLLMMYFGQPAIKSLPQKFKRKKSALQVFVEIS